MYIDIPFPLPYKRSFLPTSFPIQKILERHWNLLWFIVKNVDEISAWKITPYEYGGYPIEHCWAWNTTIVWDDMYSLYEECEGKNLMNQQGSIMCPHRRRMSAKKKNALTTCSDRGYLREKWIIIKWAASGTAVTYESWPNDIWFVFMKS